MPGLLYMAWLNLSTVWFKLLKEMLLSPFDIVLVLISVDQA